MRFLPFLVAFAAALAGCASPAEPAPAEPTPGNASPPTATPPASPTPTIPNLVHSAQKGDAYGGNVFEPATITIRAGETVTWDVTGEGHHTVDLLEPTTPGGEIPQSGDIGPGDTFEVTFPEPGTYKYYCRYHSNKVTGMVGTVVVE